MEVVGRTESDDKLKDGRVRSAAMILEERSRSLRRRKDEWSFDRSCRYSRERKRVKSPRGRQGEGVKCSGGAFWPNEGTKDEYDGDSDRDRQEIDSPSDR